MERRFSEEVEGVLKASGWHSSRQVPFLINEWKRDLERIDGIIMAPKAEGILLEFGGLTIDSKLPGEDFRPEAIVMIPPYDEGDRFDAWGEAIGADLYPLGEYESGNAFLAVDEKTGYIWAVANFIKLNAKSFDEAIQNLILGRQGEGEMIFPNGDL